MKIGVISDTHGHLDPRVEKIFAGVDHILHAGDIGAVIGCKNTTTGDTLCDPDKPVALMSVDFPEPVVHIAIEPKTKADQDKLSQALAKLADEDPTFRVRVNDETAQTIIAGMGELHLEIIIDRLRREYGVDCAIGAPQVAYRETISKAHTETYTHKKQSGGSGQYAEVKIIFEPQEPQKTKPLSKYSLPIARG